MAQVFQNLKSGRYISTDNAEAAKMLGASPQYKAVKSVPKAAGKSEKAEKGESTE